MRTAARRSADGRPIESKSGFELTLARAENLSAHRPACGHWREGGRTLRHKVVDTDYDGWQDPHGFWDESRMTALLESEPDVFVSGTVENQGTFSDRFDHVVLLSAPVDVLLMRVTARTTNPYGQTPEEQAEIRRYVVEVEPLLRAGASVELDGLQSVTELADFLERFISNAR